MERMLFLTQVMLTIIRSLKMLISQKNVNANKFRIDFAALIDLVKEDLVTHRRLASCRQLTDCFTKRGENILKL